MDMAVEELDFDISDIPNGILHFRDNLQPDAWKKSKNCITGIIENFLEQYLEAHPDGPDGCSAVFTKPGSDWQTFDLQLYKTNTISSGLSVAFTVKHKDEQYYMCCTEDMKLYFKKGVCPDSIMGNCSDVIFFQKQFSIGKDSFKFQSSLKMDYYLAVSEEGGKQKLILKKSGDELDETQMFNIKW